MTYIFDDASNVYVINDRKFIEKRIIRDIFPHGPKIVNASVTNVVDGASILFHNRLVYAYQWQSDNNSFVLDEAFPKSLHPRVLFYPHGAFPLRNGSLIIFSVIILVFRIMPYILIYYNNYLFSQVIFKCSIFIGNRICNI